ncbi:MAG: hypothetical protein JO247_15705 [Chloroflexi bacterium]|nr:hypothetical protein [Chloroflexota bacterium]
MTRFRLLGWRDWLMALLCYFCALALCASPFIPYTFDSLGKLYVGIAALGTPLAVIGIWLNHLAEKSSKKS